MIAGALQLVVQQDRLPSGRRRVTDIVELAGLEHDRYVLRTLMRYDEEQGRLVSVSHR